MPAPPLPDELQQVLANPNPAVIGTVAPDGTPNTVATWYLWEDGRVLVNMDASRARLDYLRKDPRVSLTVLDGGDWYRHVSIRGRVVSLEPDEELKDIDRLCRHYRDQDYPSRNPRFSAWIEVDTWHAWNA